MEKNVMIEDINGIKSKIFTMRNVQVILDKDLAELYQVETRALKQAVKRNNNRFPSDFMFVLNSKEINLLVSQSVIPSKKYFGGASPYVFTEQGVANLSGILSSQRAIKVNIQIMRAFVAMRKFISKNIELFARIDFVERNQLEFQMKTEDNFERVFHAIEDKSFKKKQDLKLLLNVRTSERFIYVINLITIVIKMISLLKSGHLKILRLFYTDKTAKLHLREISRRSKLHEPSTTTVLRVLEKDGVLKSEKDGNQKKYSLKLNYITYVIFQLFDGERLQSLPNIRRTAIKTFFDTLKEKPIFAVIFGSTAKGTFKEQSDMDLLIVTNSKLNTKDAERSVEALTGIRMSIFQMTMDSFLKEINMKEDPVIQSAIFSGYPVLNNIYYYEVLYNGH